MQTCNNCLASEVSKYKDIQLLQKNSKKTWTSVFPLSFQQVVQPLCGLLENEGNYKGILQNCIWLTTDICITIYFSDHLSGSQIKQEKS